MRDRVSKVDMLKERPARVSSRFLRLRLPLLLGEVNLIQGPRWLLLPELLAC